MTYHITKNGKPLESGPTREQAEVTQYATLADASKTMIEWSKYIKLKATYDPQFIYQGAYLVGFRAIDGYGNISSYLVTESA